MRRILLPVVIAALAGAVWADQAVSLNEKGNKAFEKKDYKAALDYYNQAQVERPETPEIYYNHANALQENGSYEEAAEQYTKALNTNDVSLQARICYNNGNDHFRAEEYQRAIESYQKALELAPDDVDAKFNLELARNRLKEQMQRQPQDKQQQQQQQQEQQQQQQQQQPEEQQKQQEGKNQPKPEEQEQQQDKPDEQKPQPQPQQVKKDEMSKEDAMRILNAMKNEDKENLKNQKQQQAQGGGQGKDW